MKKWILKAIIQKTISYLPFSFRLNFFFQKYITKGVNLTDEFFYDKVNHASEHLKGFENCSGKKVPESTLELGTGWYPVVPVCFYLAGSDKIYSVDISYHLSKERIDTTLKHFIESFNQGLLENYISIQKERLNELNKIIEVINNLTLSEILEKLNIVYLVEDARKLTLPDDSIELISSNNTFEHIYPDILIPILQEFKRIVKKKKGVMSHFIDMSDHFAHFDMSITIYNFLRFSDKAWKRIDNSVQPQNRLRINDYRRIYADLLLPVTNESYREGDINALKKVKLDVRFKDIPLKELATSHCQFISLINALD